MARDDLFQSPAETRPETDPPPKTPSATSRSPRGCARATLDEFAGQTHILAPGQLLRRAIEADRIQSLIFFGPPGTGKTSLAQIIARQTKSKFERLSGVESNVADMRRVLAAAANRLENTGQPTILFIDEIHRFNKAQQDVLLPDVESGVVKLIGATTHNPFFFVNSPLVSRSQIFELRPLSEEDLYSLLQRALKDEERGLGYLKIKAEENALRHLAKISDGDARKALNALEIAALTTAPDKTGVVHIDLAAAEQSIQKKAVVYDDEDAHYDTISAFIKSMRGSDPDAALYWLAKMIHAGEDPRFIARRIVICAAEDVGLADPMALVLANAALHAAEFVGWPEAQIPLAEATIYIATANKSNSAVMAISAALDDVKSGRTLDVPEAFARRQLPQRQTTGPWRRLSIRARRRRPFCRAGLSGRGQSILRANRPRRGKENQGARREMARTVRENQNSQTPDVTPLQVRLKTSRGFSFASVRKCFGG